MTEYILVVRDVDSNNEDVLKWTNLDLAQGAADRLNLFPNIRATIHEVPKKVCGSEDYQIIVGDSFDDEEYEAVHNESIELDVGNQSISGMLPDDDA